MKKMLLITSMVVFFLLSGQMTASADYSNFQQSDCQTRELPSEH